MAYMRSFCLAAFVVLVGQTTAESTLEIVEAVEITSGVAASRQVNAKEGENLTLTCKSNLESVTLEYSTVTYNNTESNNGTFTVSLTKIATKSDDRQTVKCKATNATGYNLEATATIRLAADVINVTLDGIGTVEENDKVTIRCTVRGTRYKPTFVRLLNFPALNPSLSSIINNASFHTTTEEYDNVTETYTTIVEAPPITIEGGMNGNSISCFGLVNSTYFDQGRMFTVFYGPSEDGVSLYAQPTTETEGRKWSWMCYGGYSNPPLNFTWYNGTTEFTPDTPPIIELNGNSYYSRQQWEFTFHRDFSGNNISCVVSGTNNRTVTRSNKFGDIKYDPDLVIRGRSMVDEGDTFNLTCQVTAANPMTNASWSGEVGELLVISNIKSNQNGMQYTCSATNSVGRSYLVVSINVQYGPNLYVTPTLSYEEGANITITGSVSANPAANVTWRKEGNSTVLSTYRILVLEEISREQAGVYVLEATSMRQRENSAAEEITRNVSTKLEVKYGPGSSSRLSPNVTLLEVNAGDPVPPVRCSADCVPACDFSWKQTYRNTERTRSGHLLNLGNATSAVVGIHTCKASNYISGKRYSGSVTFELRVKYAPEIQSLSINGHTGNPFSEGNPITVTTKFRAFPIAEVTWGIKNNRFTNQFMPLDSRYNTNRSVDCSYDCDITEVLTLQSPLCTDTGNQFSMYAGNEIGNSAIQTTHYTIIVSCTPRLANNSLTNQTYSTCEGAQLNMSASFISVPGITMTWFRLPDTSRYVHYNRYNDYRTVYYTTNYHIQIVYRYMFGSYIVEGNNYGGPKAIAYIEVIRDSNCSGSAPNTVATTTIDSTSLPGRRNSTSPQKSNQGGVIAAAVIGSLLVVALVVVGTIVCLRHRKKLKGNMKFEQFNLQHAQNS